MEDRRRADFLCAARTKERVTRMSDTESRNMRVNRIRDHIENTMENEQEAEALLATQDMTDGQRQRLREENDRRAQSVQDFKAELSRELDR